MDRNNVRTNFYLTKKQYNLINAVVNEKQSGISDVIRDIIDDYFKEKILRELNVLKKLEVLVEGLERKKKES